MSYLGEQKVIRHTFSKPSIAPVVRSSKSSQTIRLDYSGISNTNLAPRGFPCGILSSDPPPDKIFADIAADSVQKTKV